MEQLYYIARHLDEDICKKSSSGGAFTALTDAWFDLYGDRAVVYGCAFDENLVARHIRAVDRKKRDEMRGSKYIGSDMSGVIRAVVEDLEAGKYVVFSGTPCQIVGLKAVVDAKRLDASRLLTIDVICRGVGSVTYFQDYVMQKEKRYKSKAVSCTFRGKERKGKKQQIVIGFMNGKHYVSPSMKNDGFYAAYTPGYILRESCFKCPYANDKRNADITIADYWGETEDKKIDASTIILNTLQGSMVFKKARKNMYFEVASFEKIKQPQLINPIYMIEDYKTFWEIYKNTDFSQAQKFLGINTFDGKIRSIVVEILYRFYLIDFLKGIIRMIKRMEIWIKRK